MAVATVRSALAAIDNKSTNVDTLLRWPLERADKNEFAQKCQAQEQVAQQSPYPKQSEKSRLVPCPPVNDTTQADSIRAALKQQGREEEANALVHCSSRDI